MLRRPGKFLKLGLGLLLVSVVFIVVFHIRTATTLGDRTEEKVGHAKITRKWLLEDVVRQRSEVLKQIRKQDSKEVGSYANDSLSIRSGKKKEQSKDSLENFDDFQVEKDENNMVNYNVHAFYYAWYGSPGQDGQYYHWNHEYLPHWIAKVSAQYPTGQKHVPPEDIGASFYPLLGPYSSLDDSVTRAHMVQMQQAGIGVLALSWYPPGHADDNGKPIESYIPTIFNIADEYNIKVCFHIEPYKGRNAVSVKENLKYIIESYGDHPAFYRHLSALQGNKLPLVYIYDSYLVEASDWKRILTKSGDKTIRGTVFDAIVIGLLVDSNHMMQLAASGFDGVYTYFAADGFSYGSSKRNWKNIARNAQQKNLLFIPSVGPGYDDTRVRPWNAENTRGRRNGAYYNQSWDAAVSSPGVHVVSITSFNEWHEGTQIEPAASQPKRGGFSYETYAPRDPEYYLELTRRWSMKMLHGHPGLT